MDEEPKRFTIKVTFLDQLIVTGIIKAIGAKAVGKERTVVRGIMLYDPSDYEKMCLFADNPLNDQLNMSVEKRMEPLVKPRILHRKSWDNLPTLTMELVVARNKEFEHHHKVLSRANYMKVTLLAAYNMLMPMTVDDEDDYRFDGMSFYPKWESLRMGENVFTKGDQKLVSKIEELQNNQNIDLEHYLKKVPKCWLYKHLRQYNWPFELHIYGDSDGYSMMAFLDLFRLLYPGVRMAVPLQWINAEAMMEKCGCELLLTPNDKVPFPPTLRKPSIVGTDTQFLQPTGADDNCAFIIVEVKLARPLKKIVIPRHITRDWQATVRNAAASLRKVPYYGMTEFCIFNRQLSETRTRVELIASCWQDAAVYVNNNFVVDDFMRSDESFEEMVMMAHVCLTRTACETLVGVDNRRLMDPTLQAARHARQMQDTPHATELYLQLVVQNPFDGSCWRELAVCMLDLVVQNPFDGSCWRELAVCMLDVDRDWADVCINKLVVKNPFDGSCWRELAVCMLDVDRDWANVCINKLVVQNPFDGSCWRELAVCMLDVDRDWANICINKLVVQNPFDGSCWRELAVCMLDVDRDWANVCINKLVVQNPFDGSCWRELAVCMLDVDRDWANEDPGLAERFFVALLALYPFWVTAWVATSAYYIERELYHVAEQVIKCVKE
ncbi:Tetratricopeptide repeat family, partial [Operophtera brumata]